MTVFVKQYGYYRTGTNYLRALLDKNCDCYVCINHLGCKHSAPLKWSRWLDRPDKEVHPDLPEAVYTNIVRTAVIVKDPYAWLDSFLLYWRRRKRPPKGDMSASQVVAKVREFNRLYKIWDQFVQDNYGLVIRYECLLEDFEDVFRNMAVRLNIPLVHDPPVNIEQRVDPHPHLRRRPFDPSYFTERQYLDALSPTHKSIVSENIDWHLFRKWNYDQS